MKLAISYFYQVRNFYPHMIPLSTAVWDPKWYHNFKGQEHVFVDKHGVINGLRIQPLMPGKTTEGMCSGIEHCTTRNSCECEFIKMYRQQLDKINFNDFLVTLSIHINTVSGRLQLQKEPIVVFLVHEAPNNPCSERAPLIQWFDDNGMYVRELLYPIDEHY